MLLLRRIQAGGGRARLNIDPGGRTDLDGADLGQIGRARSELNRDTASGSHRWEGLVDRRERRAYSSDDVKVGQHRSAVDGYIEDAFADRGPVKLGELQSDIIAAVRDGKLIGGVTVTLRLVKC